MPRKNSTPPADESSPEESTPDDHSTSENDSVPETIQGTDRDAGDVPGASAPSTAETGSATGAGAAAGEAGRGPAAGSGPAAEGGPTGWPGGPAGGGRRFFGWMRGLGVVRQNGWMGGVCGGIAARLGIDPLIVRGIAVVIAVLGGPVFLLYAAGWLLLPDADDDIHLESLIRGVFAPAIVGIGVLVLFAFLPLAQGVWWTGSQFWGEPYWGQSIGRGLWSLVVIGAIVAFVIWAARRPAWSSRGGGANARTASAHSAASGSTVREPADKAGAAEFVTGASTGPATGASLASVATEAGPATKAGPATETGSPAEADGAPEAPTEPAPDASSEEFEAWKQRQQAWKEQHAAWRTQQDADARVIREQRSAEMRAQARALAAAAEAARRNRRIGNPRTSGSFVAITLGVALLGGGIAALATSNTPEWRGYEVTMGFAIATLAVGLAMMIAGAARRRSGFLAFVAILLSITTVLTALPPRDRDFVLVSGSQHTAASTRVFEPVGSYDISLGPESLAGATAASPSVIDVEQWAGRVGIMIMQGVSVRVEAVRHDGGESLYGTTFPSQANGDVTSQRAATTRTSSGGLRSVLGYGDVDHPEVIVRVSQNAGSVSVDYYTTDETGTNK